MKKILYSNYTKFIAFILCALSVAIASYMVTKNFLKGDNFYLFEDSYEDSYTAGELLSNEFFAVARKLENTMDDNGKFHADKLSNMPSPDEWEYYIKVGNATYTNTENKTYSDFETSSMAIGTRTKIDADGNSDDEGFATPYSGYCFLGEAKEDYEICLRMSPKLVAEKAAEWSDMKARADETATGIVALLSFAVILFIYLLCVTGKVCGKDEIQLMLIDKMFVEITAALFFGILIGGVTLTALGAYYFKVEENLYITNQLSATAMFAVVSLSLLCLLSLVRNLKNGTFIERSMIVRIWKFAWKWLKKICKFAWYTFIKICKRIKSGLSTAKRTILTVSAKHFDGKFIGIMIVVYSVAVALLFVIGLESPVCMMLLFLLVVAAVWFVTKRLIGFYNLKNGIEKIKNGDLNHKITDCPDGVIHAMAENINSIGDGLQESLKNEVKAERMKSELITNVSHDLKTPLTSIINYADLLSKEQLTPSEANDYVKIIKQKSQRLKQLTSDLFDISKAQSGNEEFKIEDIDICLLINQSMAEQDEEIKKAGLDFRVNASDKEIFIKGDGKKLSRVFENLFVNCVKYAMKNTRVYIEIQNADSAVTVEIKNIAGYEMDFNADEIAERFVRGDTSRSSEGSGLGLAIVKSYVEGCGGSVKIEKDGDLFKVILDFAK